MRIRFFNTFEPVSPFYRDLLPFLAEHGLNVEAVISAAEYRAGRPPLEQSVAHSRIAVRRTPGRRGLARTRRQKLAAMAAYLVGATTRSLFGPPVEVNFFLTQPPLFSLWGLVLRRLRGQKFVAMVMDLYPDVAVEDGLLPRGGLVTRALTWLARLPLRRADAVVVIGRCMRDRLIAAGVPAERIHLVPNWSNDAEVHPIPPERNALRRELGVDGDFVLLYSGNLGVSHTFDDILAAARLLRDEPGLRFVFVGDGSRRREVEAAAARDGLEAVRFFPYQPAERLAESLSMGDAHFISLRPGFEGLVVPSKAYGALATGRPIVYLGDPGGEIARMVAEEEIGAVVPPGDPERLAAVIRDLARHPERAREQGARALALHGSTYHPSALLARYLALFRALDAAPTIAPEEPAMNRESWRFKWSHDLAVHRHAVRLFNAAMRHVPFALKYGLGRRLRAGSYPYCLVHPGATVVQIGAPADTLRAGRSRGMYFSLLAGPRGRAVLVEPDPASGEAFAALVRAGKAPDNIVFCPAAAWSEKTTLRLYIDDDHPATNFTEGSKEYDPERLAAYRVIELPADTVDHLLAERGIERVDLVSITTNGAEREILKGMAGLIAAGLPFICLARTGEGYEAMMAELGYVLHAHDDRGFTFRQENPPVPAAEGQRAAEGA